MEKDLIVTTEASFLEGAESSFPASDPPSYMAGTAISGSPARDPRGDVSRRAGIRRSRAKKNDAHRKQAASPEK